MISEDTIREIIEKHLDPILPTTSDVIDRLARDIVEVIDQAMDDLEYQVSMGEDI